MFRNDYTRTSDGAAAKVAFMYKDPLAYFVVSMLAGAYIGIGVLLAFTSGGLLTGLPYARIVMGLTFGVALSLVVMAGAELFTGNNLAMAAGLLEKRLRGRMLSNCGAYAGWATSPEECFSGRYII